MADKISKLRWFRIGVLFRSRKKSAVMLSMLQAIFKGAYLDVYPDFNWHEEGAAPLFFHPEGMKFNRIVNKDDVFRVTVILCRHDRGQAESFCAALEKRMSVPENSVYYGFEGFTSFDERSYDDVAREVGPIPETGEMCLDFLLPYHSRKMKGKDASHLDKGSFIHDFEKRFSRLFGTKVEYTGKNDDFQLVPCYRDYVEVVKRNSRSNPGTKQYINGFAGKLYIKGKFPDFLKFFVLGNELHAGTKFSFGYGYYQLHREPVPYFTPRFPDVKAVVSVIDDVRERYDAVEYSAENEFSDKEEFAREICEKIEKGEFVFSPSQAFMITKKSGTKRMIERLPFTDMVVQQYLYRTIYRVFDKVFEDESIGFRKGKSRFKAETMIKKAVSEGYTHVIESDIEDFFSTVSHKRIGELLDLYIPSADTVIKDLIMKVLGTGYVLNNEIHERNVGLAQGSPISPVLANLYLDDFDEHVKSLDIRLVRYADDFVILVRSPEHAREVLSDVELFASSIGLHLKKDKTAVKKVSDGFSFLGIRFEGSESRHEDEPGEAVKLFRKPLYITEPYLFLSVNGDALEITKDKKPVEVIPFRRISEIILLDKTSFSTTFLKKCFDFAIPVTTTLSTGYSVTTLKTDSKTSFDVSFLHRKKYDSLTETEFLSIAAEFASLKIENYCTMFRKKYVKGNSDIILNLEKHAELINSAGTLDQIRGHEGMAAKIAHERLNVMIDNEKFHLKRRQRKNPDFINSLLNFGFYLLFGRINTTMRSLGLNPYLGFLHSPENTYESFVCDVEELFRAQITRIIVRMINLKIIRESDFNTGDKGAFLKAAGRRKFLNSFEGELVKTDKKTGLSLKDEMYLQILSFRKWVMEEKNLNFYRWG